MQETNDIKASLRKKYRELRRGIMPSTEFGKKLLSHCTKALLLKASDRVAGYIPMDREIDVVPLMRYCLDNCCEVLVPVVVQGSRLLEFHQWIPKGNTLNEKSKDESFPNVFLVPLVAFDKKLNRIGFGGGFYDYTIEFLRKKQECKFVGVAYELQLCENIPVDAHDQKLDLIVTEQSVYY